MREKKLTYAMKRKQREDEEKGNESKKIMLTEPDAKKVE